MAPQLRHDPQVVSEGQSVRLVAPSLRGMLRIFLVAVGFAIALYLIWRVRTVVRLGAISVFLALAVIPGVDALDRRTHVPRTIIILAVYVVLIAAVVLIGSVVVPSMVKEVAQLSHNA